MASAAMKKKLLLRALEENQLNVSRACTAAGIARDTHYRWLKSDSRYKEKVEELENAVIDFVEGCFFDSIAAGRAGSITAMIFFLKTRGKRRGWVESEELGKTDDINITFTIAESRNDKEIERLIEKANSELY